MVEILDILIKNGLIVDGTGNLAYNADLGIKDGKIIQIEKNVNWEANEVINASGLVVAPGFVDIHSHNDLVPLMNNKIENIKLMQGVTTELVGQCGLGVVPCVEGDDGLWKNYVRGVVGNPGIKWQFNDVQDYLKQISDYGLKNNYAMLISHGAIRTSIMGFDNSEINSLQLDKMCKVLAAAMEAGVHGMSLGLQYMPGIFSTKAELALLCKVVKDYDGIVMVHLRNHDNTIIMALDEIVSVALESGVKLHISHMRSYNSPQLGCKANSLIGYIEGAVRSGVDITFDEHLYLSGSTLMTQLLPPWVTGSGSSSSSSSRSRSRSRSRGLFENLSNKKVLTKIKEELRNNELHYKGWDNYSSIAGWDGIMITSLKKTNNINYIGKTIGEIITPLGMDPVDFLAQLLIDEEGGVGIVALDIFSNQDTIELINHPLQMVGSDSIPAGIPHPRLYGNYPLLIGKYVRELKAISLENAIYKSTLFPARRIGLLDRGELALNKTADITIFNFNEILGYEDYTNPTKAPIGVMSVILNGKLVVKQGEIIQGYYGKIL
jgi:N-acyl-D-amino-acid deacylase